MTIKKPKSVINKLRPCGPTDKASDYESGDSGFESQQGCFFYFSFINEKKKHFKNFLKMTDVGLEPTHPTILVPKNSALDPSANPASPE